MAKLVLFRKGGLGITEHDPFTYPVTDPPDRHYIEFTTDTVNVFLRIEVQLVRPCPDDKLYRIVTDAHGNHGNIDLPPYCPVDRKDLLERLGDFVKQNAEHFLNKQGIFFRQLVSLYREENDERLASLMYLMFIAIWKTGSGYLSSKTPLNIAPLPADSKTTPDKRPIPRYVVHCADEAADILGAGYMENFLNLFTELTMNINGVNAYIVHVALAVISHVGEKICDDFNRRRDQRAPGTNTSTLPEQIQKSQEILVGLLKKAVPAKA